MHRCGVLPQHPAILPIMKAQVESTPFSVKRRELDTRPIGYHAPGDLTDKMDYTSSFKLQVDQQLGVSSLRAKVFRRANRPSCSACRPLRPQTFPARICGVPRISPFFSQSTLISPPNCTLLLQRMDTSHTTMSTIYCSPSVQAPDASPLPEQNGNSPDASRPARKKAVRHGRVSKSGDTATTTLACNPCRQKKVKVISQRPWPYMAWIYQQDD